jgi:hypothetical protein
MSKILDGDIDCKIVLYRDYDLIIDHKTFFFQQVVKKIN